MTVDSVHDLKVFLLSVICGQIIGFIFDIFRTVRRFFPPGKRMTAFQDILFCTIAFKVFSDMITVFNMGDVRWFEIAGTILGSVIYFLSESRFVSGVLSCVFSFFIKIFGAVFGVIKKLLRLLTLPFIRIKDMGIKSVGVLKKRIRQLCIKK